ncbi:MAG: glutamate--tRNA ligase, partial [Eubacteriales bacterium]
ETKEYKASPEAYKGHVGDISSFIRTAITGKQNSPDMYSIMKIMGKEKVFSRINGQIERLSK